MCTSYVYTVVNILNIISTLSTSPKRCALKAGRPHCAAPAVRHTQGLGTFDPRETCGNKLETNCQKFSECWKLRNLFCCSAESMNGNVNFNCCKFPICN